MKRPEPDIPTLPSKNGPNTANKRQKQEEIITIEDNDKELEDQSNDDEPMEKSDKNPKSTNTTKKNPYVNALLGNEALLKTYNEATKIIEDEDEKKRIESKSRGGNVDAQFSIFPRFFDIKTGKDPEFKIVTDVDGGHRFEKVNEKNGSTRSYINLSSADNENDPKNPRQCCVLFTRICPDYIPLSMEYVNPNYNQPLPDNKNTNLSKTNNKKPKKQLLDKSKRKQRPFAIPGDEKVVALFTKIYKRTGKHPTYHRILVGDAFPLLVMDLDSDIAPVSNPKDVAEEFKKLFNDCLKEHLKEDIATKILNGLIFRFQTASKANKLSLHITVHHDDYYCNDFWQLERTAKLLDEHIRKNHEKYPHMIKKKDPIVTIIDLGIYKNNATLRMLGNTKAGEERPMLPFEYENNQWVEKPIGYKEKTQEELVELFDKYAFVYGINYCINQNTRVNKTVFRLERLVKDESVLPKLRKYEFKENTWNGCIPTVSPIPSSIEGLQKWIDTNSELSSMNLIVKDYNSRGFITFDNGNGNRDCIFGKLHNSRRSYMRICQKNGAWGGTYGCYSPHCKGKNKFYLFPINLIEPGGIYYDFLNRKYDNNNDNSSNNNNAENTIAKTNEERSKGNRKKLAKLSDEEYKDIDEAINEAVDNYYKNIGDPDDEIFMNDEPPKRLTRKQREELKRQEEKKKAEKKDPKIEMKKALEEIEKENNDRIPVKDKILTPDNKNFTKDFLMDLKQRIIDPHLKSKAKFFCGRKIVPQELEEAFESFDIVVVKAATASGKTYSFREVLISKIKTFANKVLENVNNPNFKAIFVSTRQVFADWLQGFLNKLLESIGNQRATNYQDLAELKKIELTEYPILILSVDSFHKLSLDGVDLIDMVIIDESESVVEQFNTPIIDKPRACYNTLLKACAIAKKVFVTSAHLYNRSFRMVQHISMASAIIKAETMDVRGEIKKLSKEEKCKFLDEFLNTKHTDIYAYFKKKKLISDKDIGIYYYTDGSFSHHTYEITTQEQKFWDYITGETLDGKTYILVTNSATFANKFYLYLTRFLKIDSRFILLLTGKNKKEGQFSDVNDCWKNFPIVIFTPVLTCGVSYDLPSHDAVFGYFTEKSCNAFTACQMLDRARNLGLNFKYLYITKKKTTKNESSFRSIDREEIHRNISTGDEKFIVDYLGSIKNFKRKMLGYTFMKDNYDKYMFVKRDPLYELFLDDVVVANRSRNNFLAEMIKLLKENDPESITLLGFTIFGDEAYEKHSNLIGKIKLIYDEKNFESFFDAEMIDHSQYLTLKYSKFKTEEEWFQIEKYEMAYRYNLTYTDLLDKELVAEAHKGLEKDLPGSIRRLNLILLNPEELESKQNEMTLKEADMRKTKERNHHGRIINEKAPTSGNIEKDLAIQHRMDMKIIDFNTELLKACGFDGPRDTKKVVIDNIQNNIIEHVKKSTPANISINVVSDDTNDENGYGCNDEIFEKEEQTIETTNTNILFQKLKSIRSAIREIDPHDTLCGSLVYDDRKIINQFLWLIGLRLERCNGNKMVKIQYSAHRGANKEFVKKPSAGKWKDIPN